MPLPTELRELIDERFARLCEAQPALASKLAVAPDLAVGLRRLLLVSDYACERLLALGATLLAPREGPHRSGIVTFQLPGRDANAIRRHLESAHIITRCRAGGVRLSPHGYNTTEEVDRMFSELRSL